ncbi:MAG: type I restriction-modification system subunit M [Proteobacteria bacterium]|nr:type I restriction-modification system subunit M [Pseudomonadota bacterium]MBU4297802.1 type I restriction-modification system subunit M [Pseudomonadota bacterium]MCG2748337.1 type I restriction-modification system subunit M [Desulfobulbaceae bacterium]
MIDFKEKANLIWKVADLLRGDYRQSDYGKVILPMTVLRRLDCVLAPTKQKVLDYLPKIEKLSDSAKDVTLNKVAGFNFHNRSQYDFAKLIADPDNIAANLRNFINGFSAGAREILEYFSFEAQIEKMDDPRNDLLFQVVKAFAEIDLSGMETMQMGYVFEELIRKFAELSNETAGEHFTPREVIKLMVNVLFITDRDMLTKPGLVKTMYDPACGTGGMLSVAESYLHDFNSKAKLEVFGQEINPESYAICKSDMLIKGQNPANMKFGNTFTVDGLENERFDYMLSNPPFGVDWKKAEKIIKKESEEKRFAGRFGAGLPRINDGAFLFLLHMISKMKRDGSRIGIVFNGSPLFTGQAGSGESDIRKWIIKNDWLEAVIALPDQLFYNTGISTYVWILSNQKAPERKGKIQLINATGAKDEELVKKGELPFNRFWQKMPRSLGNKRKAIAENGNEKGIGFITTIYGDFQENEFCKIFPNAFFGYWRVTVERPLKNDKGKIVKDKQGNPKPDSSLRDSENIPFLRKGENGNLVPQTIAEYFDREVRPHVPDAWIDESKTKTGYEINFTKYFYEFKSLRPLADIKTDILKLEEETAQLEKKVLA